MLLRRQEMIEVKFLTTGEVSLACTASLLPGPPAISMDPVPLSSVRKPPEVPPFGDSFAPSRS